MTKVGMAHKNAAAIYGRYSAVIRGISALRLTILSLCTVAAVLAYTWLKPALINFSWELQAGSFRVRVDEDMLLEAGMWLLVYLSYAARNAAFSRLSALGQEKRCVALPLILALLPVIFYLVPLRILAYCLLSTGDGLLLFGLIGGWLSQPLTAVIFCLIVVCCLALVALLFMAMKVATVRAIVNRQHLKKTRFLRALRQGFRYCAAPALNCLRHAFWLLASGILMVEFFYLLYMQYDLSMFSIALAVFLLAGYWLAGFGPGFWGRYHASFLSLVRILTDSEYEDAPAAE